MRKDPNLLLGRAARLHGVKPDTVRKYFPSALKRVRGRIRVTKNDRYSETLFLPDDIRVLSKWRGKKIAGVELITDERKLAAIEPALSEFSLYRTFNS
jgi:hypothetical protein